MPPPCPGRRSGVDAEARQDGAEQLLRGAEDAARGTMCSPDFISDITVDRIAAMPVAVAMQASAPSRAASRSCMVLTVGLEKRA
jgi:hypothetical protein